ncbi:uncharacterized protein erich1 isoform 2-T2 [Polymixia lowei]
MTHRKEVFQSKVLQRLYPIASKREKEPSSPCIVETLGKKLSVKRKAFQATVLGDGGTAASASHPGRRVYTVLPPPADYKTGAEGTVTLPHPESRNSPEGPDESTHESSEEPSQDEEVEEHRRKRKRKKKKPASHKHSVKEAQEGDPGTDLPGTGPSQAAPHEGGELLSRNKRRKLKKKRHKDKLLSLGLVPRAAALEFTYQKDREEEEEEEDEGKRAAEVSEFLRTTTEMYMSDRSVKPDRPPLLSVAVENLLSSMSNGSAPPTVLGQLHNLKALVQRKEPDRLAKALEELHNNSSMSPEETSAVISLFQYWITDILSMQRDMKAGQPTTQLQDCQSD